MGLADTACGLATRALLPEGASGFTTIELKTNFLGHGARGADRHGRHERARRADDAGLGRRGVRTPAPGKTIALFRCTQSVLWPR